MTVLQAVGIALGDIRRQLSPTSQKTWISHAKDIVAHFGPDTPMLNLTRKVLQEWVDEMLRKGYTRGGQHFQYKVSTVKHYAALIGRMWRVLEERDLDDGRDYPMRRVRFPKRNSEKRTIAPETVEAIQEKLSPANRQVVVFTANTCCRRLEVFAGKCANVQIWEDGVDAQGQKLYLGTLRLETSKTGKPRTVPLNHQAAAIARERVATGQTYLFGSQIEDRYKVACNWAKNVWGRVKKKLGCSGHFHGLRHFGAKVAYAQGAAIEAISQMLGHSNIPQTEHYLSLKQELAWQACYAIGLGYKKETAEPWAIFRQGQQVPAAPPPPTPAPAPAKKIPPLPPPRTAGFMMAGPRLAPLLTG